MGKYHSYANQPPKTGRHLGIHPAWYVAGIFFMFLVPLLTFAMAELLFRNPGWLPELTKLLMGATDLYVRPGQFGAGVTVDKYLFIKLIVTVALSAVLYALFALVTFAINGMFGGTRYGPYDMPPVPKPRGVRMRKAR